MASVVAAALSNHVLSLLLNSIVLVELVYLKLYSQTLKDVIKHIYITCSTFFVHLNLNLRRRKHGYLSVIQGKLLVSMNITGSMSFFPSQ